MVVHETPYRSLLIEPSKFAHTFETDTGGLLHVVYRIDLREVYPFTTQPSLVAKNEEYSLYAPYNCLSIQRWGGEAAWVYLNDYKSHVAAIYNLMEMRCEQKVLPAFNVIELHIYGSVFSDKSKTGVTTYADGSRTWLLFSRVIDSTMIDHSKYVNRPLEENITGEARFQRGVEEWSNVQNNR